MKNNKSSKKNEGKNKRTHSPDFTSPDINSDKTGADNDSDRTVKIKNPTKSKLEIDPDSTGIDTKADKTKKENGSDLPKNPSKDSGSKN